jgi:hypothetical protein
MDKSYYFSNNSESNGTQNRYDFMETSFQDNSSDSQSKKEEVESITSQNRYDGKVIINI